MSWRSRNKQSWESKRRGAAQEGNLRMSKQASDYNSITWDTPAIAVAIDGAERLAQINLSDNVIRHWISSYAFIPKRRVQGNLPREVKILGAILFLFSVIHSHENPT